MSTRTILAPGVEITEKDLSEYTSTAGASTALVMGFANQGQNYETVNLTSKTALVNYFGKPTNEAERYFFAACSEVLAQNGRLYAAKLPYDNESADKHVVAQYEVGTDKKTISSLTDVLSVDDESIYGDTTLSTNSAFVNDLRDTFFGGVSNLNPQIKTEILSSSDPEYIYTKISEQLAGGEFESQDGIIETNNIIVTTASLSNYVIDNDADYLPDDVKSSISVDSGEVSSYFSESVANRKYFNSTLYSEFESAIKGNDVNNLYYLVKTTDNKQKILNLI